MLNDLHFLILLMPIFAITNNKNEYLLLKMTMKKRYLLQIIQNGEEHFIKFVYTVFMIIKNRVKIES